MKRLSSSEDGIYLPLVAVTLVTLLMLLGLAIDVGSLYLADARLQRGVDTASLSGMAHLADRIITSPTAEVLKSELEEDIETLLITNLVENGYRADQIIDPGISMDCNGSVCPAVFTRTSPKPTMITATAQLDLPLYLLSIIPDIQHMVIGGASGSKGVASRGPVAVSLLIDTSGTMRRQLPPGSDVTRLDRVREAIERIVGAFNPEIDRLGLFAFNETGREYLPFNEEPGFDPAEFSLDEICTDPPPDPPEPPCRDSKLAVVGSGGDTNMALGLRLATDRLSKVDDDGIEKAVLLFSDGGVSSTSAAWATPGLPLVQRRALTGYAGNPYQIMEGDPVAGTWKEHYYYVDVFFREPAPDRSFRLFQMSEFTEFGPNAAQTQNLFQYQALFSKLDSNFMFVDYHDPTYSDYFNLDVGAGEYNFCGNIPAPDPATFFAANPFSRTVVPPSPLFTGFPDIEPDDYPNPLPNNVGLINVPSKNTNAYQNQFGPVAGTEAHCLAFNPRLRSNVCFYHPRKEKTGTPFLSFNQLSPEPAVQDIICPPTDDDDPDFIFPPNQFRYIRYQFVQSALAEADFARMNDITVYTIGFGAEAEYAADLQSIANPSFYNLYDFLAVNGYQSEPDPNLSAFQEIFGQGVPEIFLRRIANDPIGYQDPDNEDPKFHKFPYSATVREKDGKFIRSDRAIDELQSAYARLSRQILLDSLRLTE